jgi:cell wall-associated NlpC family hydrolase
MRRAVLSMAALLAAVPGRGLALPPAKATRAVSAARELLGARYELGGRLRRGGGIDCQGVVFYALERISSCGWRSYSVFPTATVRDREMGAPVEGLFPVATAALDPTMLLPGDVVMLVATVENPAEPALASLHGAPVWAWHLGMATGGGLWINADPYSGQVQEGELAAYLKDHPEYTGIAVTRMADGPQPAVCKHHARMRPPRQT